MDGSHPDADPVPNEHIVTVDWFRTTLEVIWAPRPHWELEFRLPYDVKRVKAEYELPDGTPYANPVADLHHRSETLEGVADLELMAHHRIGRFRLGAGLSLPTGRIEEDPYELGDLGLRHQHMQFGSGTVDPVLKAGAALPAGPVTLDASAGLKASLYENRKDYRGPLQADFAAGATWRAADWAALSLHYTALYQGGAAWDGDRDPNAGYFLQGLSFSAPLRLSPSVTLRPNVLWVADVNLRGDSDTFELDWTAGISLDVAIDRPIVEEPSSP